MSSDSVDYSRWFSKDSISIADASLLLYGLNPDKWNYSEPKADYREEQIMVFGGDLNLSDIESLLHDLRCDLSVEVVKHNAFDWHSEVLSTTKLIQWAYDVSDRFWFSGNFINYIKDGKHSFDYKDNSWIDREYSKWASLDSWSLEQAADLLSGSQVHRGYEVKSWHMSQRRDGNQDMLQSLARTDIVKTKEIDGVIYFQSKPPSGMGNREKNRNAA